MKTAENLFIMLPAPILNQQTAAVIRECNPYTQRFGLMLSEQEIGRLVENRREALEQMGRIEFGGGVIQKLIMEFADSAYLNQDDYADTLIQLQECFYYFKGEAQEELPDDELIHLMKLYYEDVCQGSVEYLQTTMLENHCRDIRYGTQEYRASDGYEDNYIDFLDWDGGE